MKDNNKDNIRISTCILCLREASKAIQGIDDALSDSILLLAAALSKRMSEGDKTIDELQSIKDELERS